MKLEQALILAEDTPQSYIEKIIDMICSTGIHASCNFKDINKSRKKVETTRTEKNTGRKLSNEEFDKIALDYFDKTYPQYKKDRQTIIDALLDYHI